MKEELIIVSNETTNSVSISPKRRNLNKAIWATPLIGSVALPSHAQTTPTTNPPVEPESICGVDRCPAMGDFMLEATVHEYYEGDMPDGSNMIPTGFVGWNSAVRIIGCDNANITTVWTTHNNDTVGAAFVPIRPELLVDDRNIDEENWFPGGASIPNRTSFVLIQFRVEISSPGCSPLTLNVDYSIIGGNRPPVPPAHNTNYADSFVITVSGDVVNPRNVTIPPTTP